MDYIFISHIINIIFQDCVCWSLFHLSQPLWLSGAEVLVPWSSGYPDSMIFSWSWCQYHNIETWSLWKIMKFGYFMPTIFGSRAIKNSGSVFYVTIFHKNGRGTRTKNFQKNPDSNIDFWHTQKNLGRFDKNCGLAILFKQPWYRKNVNWDNEVSPILEVFWPSNPYFLIIRLHILRACSFYEYITYKLVPIEKYWNLANLCPF